MQVLAFDIYGTLVDTSGITAELSRHIGDRALDFAQLWREKQLEYTFRRALMKRYEAFPECVRHALDFCCTALDEPLDKSVREQLLLNYRALPAFDDALPALKTLHDLEYRMFAFSNGIREDVESLLEHAGIAEYFADIVSADEIGTFKPDPAIYQHFLARASARGKNAWLISGNSFDVIGAVAAGMRAAWVRRTAGNVLDPWEFEPDAIVTSLDELESHLAVTEQ